MAKAQHPKWPHIVITLLVLSFAVPPEVSINAGPLRFSPYRVLLLILFVPMLLRLMKQSKGQMSDYLILGHGVWAMIALSMSMGVGTAIESGGIYIAETAGAYMVGRLYIKTADDFAALCRLLVTFVTLLMWVAIIESLSGVHFIRDISSGIFGGPGAHDMDKRMGLTRAFTSFEHPILFGVFSASAFAGTYYVVCGAKINLKTIKSCMAVLIATFLSLSGGPFTAVFAQIALMGWDKITAGIKGRWQFLMLIGLAIWTLLSLMSNRSPVLIFVSYLTFSTQSAYNRVHIWEYGTAEVARHPLFGIGFNDWIRAPWMSDSMDTFWLLTTVRYGLPALIFMLAAVGVIAAGLMRQTKISPQLKLCAKAWLVTFAGFFIAGLTVHFWNALMVQFFFLLGCGNALACAKSLAPTLQKNLPPLQNRVGTKRAVYGGNNIHNRPTKRRPLWN